MSPRPATRDMQCKCLFVGILASSPTDCMLASTPCLIAVGITVVGITDCMLASTPCLLARPKRLRWAVIGITTLPRRPLKLQHSYPNYPFGIFKGRDTRELVKAAFAPAARPRTLTAPPASLPSAPPCPACWRRCKSLHKHKHASITNTSTHTS